VPLSYQKFKTDNRTSSDTWIMNHFASFVITTWQACEHFVSKIHKFVIFCSGLLHMSNITNGQLRSVADVLKVGETVKALVIKSASPERIALSTKDLESEPGLFITNKEKVFSEAEEMAQRYREQIAEPPRPAEAEDSCNEAVPFDNEAQSYANWKWLKF